MRAKTLYTAEIRARRTTNDDGDAVSAADVLSALEQLGETLRGGTPTGLGQPAPQQAPTVSAEVVEVATELKELSRRIDQVKSEVGAIKHPLSDTDRIKDATSHLGTIVGDMEVATNRILEGAEQVEATLSQMLVFSGGNQEISKLNTEATAQVIRMMEACSFQDVSGQRVARVLRLFDEIETHISTIIDYFGPEAFANIPVDEGDGADTDGVALHGPQSAGEGISQDEIDALFD